MLTHCPPPDVRLLDRPESGIDYCMILNQWNTVFDAGNDIYFSAQWTKMDYKAAVMLRIH